MSLLLRKERKMIFVSIFGDSMLDCSYDYAFVGNHDQLLEQHADHLVSPGPAHPNHRAQDGTAVSYLPAQAHGFEVEGEHLTPTMGDHDVLREPDRGSVVKR
jgi:hypothetical protein